MPPLTHLGHHVDPPRVWKESRVAQEYLALLQDPIFEAEGLAGGGRPVLLIPGFMAGDSSLATMSDWLRRAGYRAELPGLTLNVRYSEIVLRGLTARLGELAEATGTRVTLIGHSRGGLLAKVLSHRHRDQVEQVVTLGSPLRDPYDIHPLTMAGVRLAHAFNLVRYRRTSSIEHRFLRHLAAPPRVPTTSIFSRDDGIVHWGACLRPDVRVIEVSGSHVGLGVNVAVYEHLARLLPVRRRP